MEKRIEEIAEMLETGSKPYLHKAADLLRTQYSEIERLQRENAAMLEDIQKENCCECCAADASWEYCGGCIHSNYRYSPPEPTNKFKWRTPKTQEG